MAVAATGVGAGGGAGIYSENPDLVNAAPVPGAPTGTTSTAGS
ncbi:MAG: hypothetical protein AVDCRST_MAG40-3410 [uncultured Gemmatimonadaceae bacterium]|uniref:Uncharacterized protein n=1 Tax=uncultured Gemmatimonadaceae bacterium TaxID=246130 RepID=A0A6J4MKA1_9BACT|nr:MAG: hypothetical protein AVDCRST_MAG40-3410 [uncultured Gemmatimonadaceae bacterium]